jgi:transcriptional regulator GlxA family with amidase domain
MNRRQFLGKTALLSTTLGATGTLFAASSHDRKKTGAESSLKKLTPPSNGPLTVAILISEGVNVIDFSGPWGVFESVSLPNATEMPFRLLAVADTSDVVSSASGLKIKPDFTFANMPEAKVVVIPAQKGSETMREWLRNNWQATDVTMSVCTGAFQLAKAGLLKGLAATTHHEFQDELEKKYPDIQVKRGVRFVENEKISTAGGLTSGTDLALRVVERYFGREVAQHTAAYMEYRGMEWMV